MSTKDKNFYIPNFAYPFKKIQNEEKYYEELVKENHGNYLFSKTGFWHGGIHFNDSLTQVQASDGIRAIADGELVAFRINEKYEQNDDEEKDLEGLYSTGFFLLKHKLEYPKDNILNFFSLYMHTAKLDEYDFSSHKMKKKDTIRSVEKYVDASTGKIKDLDKDTKLTLGTLNQFGRYQILQIDGKNQTGICTVDKGSVIPLEEALKLKTIDVNTSASKNIQFPKTKIEIKAGEVIGLVGENNIKHGTKRKVLHLEIFTEDDIKTFVENAKKHYENPNTPKEEKPKATQIKIEASKTLYEKICECSLKSDANIREGYSNSSSKYNNQTSKKGTKLEVDLSKTQKIGKYTRVLVKKIDGVDVKNYTVVISVLENKKTVFKQIKEQSTKKEIESKDIKIEEDSAKEKYLLYEENENKYIKYKECKEYHPITFDWAKIVDESSEDDISIFTNLHKFLLPDVQAYKEEVLKVSAMYEKLFKEIDTHANNEIEAQELEDATKNEAIKKITSKFIVKHSSEWDKKVNVPKNIKEILEKHKDNIKNYYAIKQHLENEEKRIDNYAFFNECSSIEGFPTSDKVFHINPIGLVGEFGTSRGCLTMEKFKQIFPSASEDKRKEVLEVFNKYCHAFEINTPLRVAHFFAQVKEEVGETINFKNESLNYSAKRLKTHKNTTIIDDDGRTKKGAPFSYFWNNHNEANLYGSIKKIGQTANQKAIANRVYANRNGNGNIASGDGWNFRGKGFIQLTGRTNYENANKEIQVKVPNSNVDIITNPKSILTVEGAMVSSMAYWTMNNLNTKADNAGWDREKVDNITNTVNSGTSSRENRKENFDLIQNILNN